MWRGRAEWWSVGEWAAGLGIVTALVAAVPGFIDYFRSVPPKSSAKKRATYHMAVNLTCVGLFAIAWGESISHAVSGELQIENCKYQIANIGGARRGSGLCEPPAGA